MSRQKPSPLKPDFDAAALLKSHLGARSRKRVWGITIDSPEARLLDVGLFIAKLDQGWRVDVSIADVPAMIPDRSEIEFEARRRGYDRNGRNGKVERMFPRGLLLNYVSLSEGAERPAITFSIILDENLNIKKYDISRTIFLNKKQCNDNDIQAELQQGNPEVGNWVGLARSLRDKRQDEMAERCDLQAGDKPDIGAQKSDTRLRHRSRPGDLLVHEMMRLANRTATQFLLTNRIAAPLKPSQGEVDVTGVTPCLAFDRDCNTLAWNLVRRMERHSLPATRVTSPMREYKDFLALKIMARQLDGLVPDDSLTRQSLKISEHFNEKAARASSGLLDKNWEAEWNSLRTHQGELPARLESQRALEKICADRGWKTPLLAERVLMVNGVEVALAVFRCKTQSAKWAVHADPAIAREMAASRMVVALEPPPQAMQSDPKIS